MTTERPLTGRNALVTGASRGIGRAIALELGRAGASVIVNYRRDADAADEVVAELREIGTEAHAVPASVDSATDIARLADESLAKFPRIDIVVANAGRASRGQTVLDSDPEEFEALMATHAFSLQRLVQRLLPGMREAERGDIIAISSSEVDAMKANGAPYNMAKAALEALALTLAKEEARNGIRVNIVAPGLVVTDMGSRAVKAILGVEDISELDADQPFGRLTRPEDIAATIRFLVSSGAAQVTGQRIVVDGGADASPTGYLERLNRDRGR